MIQGHQSAGDILPVVAQNISGGESQDLLFPYWKRWEMSVRMFPVTNKFVEKIIYTNISGFMRNYSVDDLVPFQSSPGGLIDVNLFKGIQNNWEARQTLN